MKIVDVRPVLLTAPYRAMGAQASRRSACFVEVETDDGIIGIGETYAGVYVPELAVAIVNWFKPFLIGTMFKLHGGDLEGLLRTDVGKSAQEGLAPIMQGIDARNPHLVYRRGYWLASYVGRTGLTVMVLSGIENAVWDILGKALGVPVHVVLGGAVQPAADVRERRRADLHNRSTRAAGQIGSGGRLPWLQDAREFLRLSAGGRSRARRRCARRGWSRHGAGARRGPELQFPSLVREAGRRDA